MKAKEVGVELADRAPAKLSDELEQLEADGFVFEAADASLELLMRQATGWTQDYFEVEGYRATTYHRPVPGSTKPVNDTEATVKLWVGDERFIAVGEGNGPVNALDQALRGVLVGSYPHLAHIHLTDYRVRILDTESDTDAVVRVLIDSTDGERPWTTIVVSTNIIEASWQALAPASSACATPPPAPATAPACSAVVSAGVSSSATAARARSRPSCTTSTAVTPWPAA